MNARENRSQVRADALVGFEARGIVPIRQKVLAYGGDWKSARGRSAAFVTVDVVPQAVSEV